tara:strand:- start:1143 stop:1259 length:117 start_codon:yes stop_codon:yes gene_type:complete
MKDLYEQMKDDMSDNQNNTPKVQISLEDAMNDLGLDNG